MNTETNTDLDLSAPITIGDFTFDLSAVANRKNIYAAMRRGLVHYMGNEQSAKVTAWKKTEEGASATDEDVAAKLAELQSAAFTKFMEGEIGVRVGGGTRSKSAFESLMRTVAIEKVKAALAKNKVTMPTGDKTISMAGKEFTREQLIESALKRWDASIREEANRRLAAQVEEEESLV